MIPVTLRDVLQLEAFEGSRLVAGCQGLDHPVRAVTVDEVPDGFRFLRGGELVLTSFYAPSRAPAHRLRETVARYVERRVAAVAFKPGRFVQALPEAVVELAEAAPLPMVALPGELAWPDLVLPVAQHLFLAQSEALAAAADVKTLVERLSHFLARPVVLEGPHLEMLAASSTFSPAHHGTTAEWWRTQPDPGDWYRAPQVRVVHWRGNWRQVLPVWDREAGLQGFLTVLHDGPAAPTPSPLARQAGLAAALLLGRQQAVDLAGGGAAADWLAELVTRGRPPVGSSRVYVLTPAGAVPADRCRQVAAATVAWARQQRLGLAVMIRSERVVVLAPAQRDEEAAADPVAEGLRQLTAERFPDVKVSAGRACGRPEQWPDSFQDAMREQRAAAEGADWSALVARHVPEATLRTWIERWLGPVRAYDRAHGSELLLTLTVFFECRQHAGETARRLSVHRNTVLYRLAQVRRLTGLDLSDPEQSLTCRIALALGRHLLS